MKGINGSILIIIGLVVLYLAASGKFARVIDALGGAAKGADGSVTSPSPAAPEKPAAPGDYPSWGDLWRQLNKPRPSSGPATPPIQPYRVDALALPTLPSLQGYGP